MRDASGACDARDTRGIRDGRDAHGARDEKEPRRREPTGLFLVGHHAADGAGIWLSRQGSHVSDVPGGVALRAGPSPTGLATAPLSHGLVAGD